MKSWENFPAMQFFDVLADDINAWAKEKGFWNQPKEINTVCAAYPEVAKFIQGLRKTQKHMLVVTEVAELTEEVRKPGDLDTEGFTNEEIEVADTIIRLLDYAANYRLRVGAAIAAKMLKNEGRPYQHGKAF